MSTLEKQATGIYYNIGKIELTLQDFDNVEKVLQRLDLTIEEFCAYAMGSIAESLVNSDGTVTGL